VVSERVTADSGSAPTLRVLINGFRDDRTPYTTIFFINGGMGARAGRDGLSATCFPSNVVCGSMEIIEALAPLRIWQKELAVDSGGAGRFRGGLGQDVEIELIGRERANISVLSDRARHPAEGLLDGQAGSPSRITLNGQENAIPTKGKSRIKQGDRLRIRYPGGGGYGDPRHRSKTAVQNDLEEGLVSKDTAQRIYGL
jgi:N-methylhydantoinase B